MHEWFAAHSGLEQFFLLCAIVGGVVVLLRLLLSLIGLGEHDGALDSTHDSSDAGFQILSIQAISSFFTLFGLVGYTLYHNAHLGLPVTLLGAVAAGAATVWIMGRIFMLMLKLQSSGSVGIDAALGCEGTVYVTVTGAGGSVQVNVANRLREFDATSVDGAVLPSGTPIRVERIAGTQLVVSRLN